MKKFLSLLFAVIITVFALSSCSLTIKDSGSDDTQSDTGTSDTGSGGIIPGENELPAIPIGPSLGEIKTDELH